MVKIDSVVRDPVEPGRVFLKINFIIEQLNCKGIQLANK